MNAVVTVHAPRDGCYSGMSKETTPASSYELYRLTSLKMVIQGTIIGVVKGDTR